MNIKKIVAGSLIISLSATTVVLAAGTVVPASFLDTISANYFGGNIAQEIAALDENGKVIEGAVISKNPDGTVTVKDAEGKVIEEVSTRTQLASGQDPNSTAEPGSDTPVSPGNPSSTPSPTPTPSPSPSPSPSPAPTPPPSPAPPAPAPPPQPQCGSGGTCTAAQVATHNTQSNCWVIYNSKVYNVTAYVSNHPGGKSVFNNNTCGKNITTYLQGTREPVSGERFSHSSGDISDINPYYIAGLSG